MYNINSKFVVADNYVSPDNNSLAGFATHIDKFGFGGLKTFSQSSMIYNPSLHYIGSGTATMSNNRSSVGQIVYLNSSNTYYMCFNNTDVPKFAPLPGLTTGAPTFPGLTSSAGILITNGANISFSAGGNIATTGTASFGGITSSVLDQYYVPVANSTKGLVNSAIQDNGSSLITLGRATYVSSNFQANGTISAVTGFTSSAGYLKIGGAATASTGFHSPGTSNLTTLNVSTISSSGLATLTDLYVPGNTQLGNAATDTTSVWGTLNIVNDSSNSGSITCDSNGNLIFDGSGAGGVEITDGLMYLGSIPIQSGSYGGTSYNGGMISSSMKVVALHGFSNRTNDDDASFEVDTDGNLECRSLKETSLRAYKHELQYITESQLQNISKLKPLTFLYNIDNPEDVNDPQLRQAGFIAQQVQQIYPEVAWYKEGKLAGLQYQRLTAYLTKGIQELAEQNKLLKSRVQSLEQLVNGILQGAK